MPCSAFLQPPTTMRSRTDPFYMEDDQHDVSGELPAPNRWHYWPYHVLPSNIFQHPPTPSNTLLRPPSVQRTKIHQFCIQDNESDIPGEFPDPLCIVLGHIVTLSLPIAFQCPPATSCDLLQPNPVQCAHLACKTTFGKPQVSFQFPITVLAHHVTLSLPTVLQHPSISSRSQTFPNAPISHARRHT